MRTSILALSLILSFGCISEPKPAQAPLVPSVGALSPDTRSRAESIARHYAVDRLGLTQHHVDKMKADFAFADGAQLTIQFYDPKVFHPNSDGFFVALDGGFPSYFTITVDIQSWQVVKHYASPE